MENLYGRAFYAPSPVDIKLEILPGGVAPCRSHPDASEFDCFARVPDQIGSIRRNCSRYGSNRSLRNEKGRI